VRKRIIVCSTLSLGILGVLLLSGMGLNMWRPLHEAQAAASPVSRGLSASSIGVVSLWGRRSIVHRSEIGWHGLDLGHE